ncbi:hypothetical protein ABIB26_004707 [Arthrobacter sp. UYEF20]
MTLHDAPVTYVHGWASGVESGWPLVARIVRRAAGTLDVFPGPGGSFEVWLPANPHLRTRAGEAGIDQNIGG